MTEAEALPADIVEAAAEPPAEIPPQTPPPALRPKRTGLVAAVIVLVCLVIVLAGTGAWVWLNPGLLPGGGGGAPEVAALQRQVAELSGRVGRLEAAPKAAVPAPASAPAAPVSLAPIEARLAALEQRPAAAAATAPAAASLSAADLAALRGQVADEAQKLAALNQTVASLGSRVQGADSQTAAQLQALQGQMESAGKLGAEVTGLAARAGRLSEMQAASAALAAGKPLGVIAGAPPALSRFAVAAPPTEASLRLAFPGLAAQALAAAAPEGGKKPFLDRVWGRMQQAVTIRAGDRVIVGNPAAAILARAQAALDAGDLAGALAELGKLPADAAAPLAGWLDQAGALLAARAALAEMAARA